MSDEQQQVGKVVKFISRNLRLILICLLCGLTAGLAVYLIKPKVYKASAIIMYQLQQVNPGKMSPEVQTRMLEMVNNVGQQVTSRSSLEEIIVANGLYPELRKKLPMEDVVVAMRSEHITIEPKAKADTFLVSFEGDDPRQVMVTTNALASKFIEENIRYREQRAKDTSAYIKDELAMAKTSLDKQEESMRDYKLRHYNEMPDQSATNIARLTSLQTHYQEIQNNLQDLKRSQILIQEQITLRGTTPGVAPPSELAKVRQELETLQSRYTENHPDIKRLQGRLAVLMKAQNEAGGAATLPGGIGSADPRLAQLDKQFKDIDISVDRLLREQEATRQQMGRLQGWIGMTPVREAEWAALTRDYNQLQQHYQALVARSLEADSAELMENRQKGSQFKIIEPALLPNNPFSPDFVKIMLVAALLGMGAGLGIAYVMDFLDTSFSNVEALESYLGLPVTCAIPVLQTAKEKEQFRLRNIIWAAGLGAGFLIMGIIMLLLWWNGKIIL